MPPGVTGRTRPTKVKKHANAQKRKRDDVDAEKLQKAVDELDPTATYSSFSDLPLSEPTVAGLRSAHFSTLTDIQAKAIALGLRGADILGAAKTGSGKTLAFLVPVLENLYRSQYVGADAGLGAMIISPTRELALQIFEVLKKVGGKGHLFAAGLIIGGKSLREEQDTLARMNIVVCTPGRILQHLSGTSGFSADNLRMLVLDEADRIMDMGFQKEVDAILEYLPPDRQTLLFSATQTKRVSDLSRLALKDPEYISVHEAATAATPQTLQQNYVVTPLPEKLDTLWSFLQASKTSKILVFLSSGKQVRFVYESFRHMQPGIPLLHLHGRQKQNARMEITQKFSRAKHSCLFATDVVARGLDFPAVDWVIQVDCPEDTDTYIHRVGRTARYEKSGRAVLFLDPSEEEGMLSRLEQRKVPIERINIRAKKQHSIKSQLQRMCLKDPALKYLGQTAFVSYVKSLRIQKDKEIFQLEKYALEEFAASLGLPGAPRIKFLKADAEEAKRRKNAPRTEATVSGSEDGESGGEDEDAKKDTAKSQSGVRTRYDRMFERQNQDILADHYKRMVRADEDGDMGVNQQDGEQSADEEELFKANRSIPARDISESDSVEVQDFDDATVDNIAGARSIRIPGANKPLVLDSKRREKLLKSKKKLLKLKDKGSKLVFDDDGNAHELYVLEDEDDFKARGSAAAQRQKFVDEEEQRVRQADVDDKRAVKEKKKAKREKRKERERAEAEADAGGPKLDGGEDAMTNFLADAEDVPEASESDVDEEIPRTKKQKKWYDEDRRKAPEAEQREIETLDDLEAEAARLLR